MTPTLAPPPDSSRRDMVRTLFEHDWLTAEARRPRVFPSLFSLKYGLFHNPVYYSQLSQLLSSDFYVLTALSLQTSIPNSEPFPTPIVQFTSCSQHSTYPWLDLVLFSPLSSIIKSPSSLLLVDLLAHMAASRPRRFATGTRFLVLTLSSRLYNPAGVDTSLETSKNDSTGLQPLSRPMH